MVAPTILNHVAVSASVVIENIDVQFTLLESAGESEIAAARCPTMD
jgi:hypothetical protein